jgi:hypothetical protein
MTIVLHNRAEVRAHRARCVHQAMPGFAQTVVNVWLADGYRYFTDSAELHTVYLVNGDVTVRISADGVPEIVL